MPNCSSVDRWLELKVTLAAPFGAVVLIAQDMSLVKIELIPEFIESGGPVEHPVFKGPVASIQRYLNRPESLSVPDFTLNGTPFQRKVWETLIELRPSELVTYGDLAVRLSSGARAVAGALKANPFPILIPCHRVVGQSSLGGFCGKTDGPMMAIKYWLLRHEGVPLP